MRQITDVIEDLKAKKAEAQKRSELSSDIGDKFSHTGKRLSSSIEQSITDALYAISNQSEKVTSAQTKQLASLISWFIKSSKETSNSVKEMVDYLKEEQKKPINISVPDVVVPEIKIPEIKVPQVVVPEIKVPDVIVPEIKLPEINVKVPKINVPEVNVTVPPIKMPNIEVPKAEITVTTEREEMPSMVQDLTDMQGNGQIIFDYTDRTETLVIDGRTWTTSVVMK